MDALSTRTRPRSARTAVHSPRPRTSRKPQRLVAGRYRLHLQPRRAAAWAWSGSPGTRRSARSSRSSRYSGVRGSQGRRPRRPRALSTRREPQRAFATAAWSGSTTWSRTTAWPGLRRRQRLGRTLQEALDAEGPLPAGEVTRVGLCLLDALRATHQAGVVHCDVKPSNVYLCDDARTLTHFGNARWDRRLSPRQFLTGGFVGSPWFVACTRAGRHRRRWRRRRAGLRPVRWERTSSAAVEGQQPFRRDTILASP